MNEKEKRKIADALSRAKDWKQVAIEERRKKRRSRRGKK